MVREQYQKGTAINGRHIRTPRNTGHITTAFKEKSNV